MVGLGFLPMLIFKNKYKNIKQLLYEIEQSLIMMRLLTFIFNFFENIKYFKNIYSSISEKYR